MAPPHRRQRGEEPPPLGASDDGIRATEIGVLPSDIAFAPDGALLFSQSQPEPAVRRVDPETGVVSTILR